MKVLVTGLSGFTGQYLKLELESYGHTVIGLNADLLDLKALEHEICYIEPDAVVHLAGIAFVGYGEPNDFYHVNLLGSRNLLVALTKLENHLRMVLLASSANVYGNVEVDVLSEQSSTNPVNDYAVSKLSMEYMARLWLDKLPISIVRPFNYTGVGQSISYLLPKIVDHFVRKSPYIELGNLDVARDFSDVRMVVNIYRRLLESSTSIGETFNICSNKAYSIKEIINILQKISNHKIEIHVKSSLIRKNEIKVLIGSNSKIEHCLGYINKIPLSETLEWMFRSH